MIWGYHHFRKPPYLICWGLWCTFRILGKTSFYPYQWGFQLYSCCISIDSSNLGHPQKETRWQMSNTFSHVPSLWKGKTILCSVMFSANMLWRSKGLQFLMVIVYVSISNAWLPCKRDVVCKSFFLDRLRGAMSQYKVVVQQPLWMIRLCVVRS